MSYTPSWAPPPQQSAYAPAAMPSMDLSMLGMTIDPSTGQPVPISAPAAGGMGMPGLAQVAPLAIGGYVMRKPIGKLATSGLTRGRAAAQGVSGLASRGAAARAGLFAANNGGTGVSEINGLGQLARQFVRPGGGTYAAVADEAGAMGLQSVGRGAIAGRMLATPGVAAAGYGLAGQLGAMGVDRLNIGGKNSTADQALTGAAWGAGTGAAVGSVVPVLGTAVGAGVGAGLGAIGNVALNKLGVFGGHDDKDKPKVDMNARQVQTDTFNLRSAALDLGLSKEETAALMANYNIAVRQAGDDPKLKAQYSQQAASALLQQLPQTLMQNKAMAQGQKNEQSWITALQNWAAPYAEQSRLASEVQAQAFESMAGQAKSPEQAALYKMQAANARKNSATASSTWMQQLALAPGNQALAQQQQQQQAMMQSYVSQLQQKAISDSINPQAASTDFASSLG